MAREKKRSAKLHPLDKWITGRDLLIYQQTIVAPQVGELHRRIAELEALVRELTPNEHAVWAVFRDGEPEPWYLVPSEARARDVVSYCEQHVGGTYTVLNLAPAEG